MSIKESDLLISIFSEVIGIDIPTIEKLIEENGTAKFFLEQDKALSITSSLENLKILARFLLFREYGDLSRIKERDINFINDHYNIKLYSEHVINGKNYSDIEIIDLFEEKRNIDKDLRISTLLKTYNKTTATTIIKNSSNQLQQISNNLKAINELLKNYQNKSTNKKNKNSNNASDLFFNKIISQMIETVLLLNSSKYELKDNKKAVQTARSTFNKFFRLSVICSRRNISEVYCCKYHIKSMLNSLENGEQIGNVENISNSLNSLQYNSIANVKKISLSNKN